MELVGQMYKLSACFDTPNEYKGLPYDYFPDDAVSYGSTICSFGLAYNVTFLLIINHYFLSYHM